MRRYGVLIFVLVFLLALPAAAAHARPAAAPVVTGGRPLKLGIGDTLIIRGRNFIPGKRRNTIAFQRVRARAIFVRADKAATATQIKITVPEKLRPYLKRRGAKQIDTRFALRVLSRRFAKSFTPFKMSPLIGPVGKTTAGAPGGVPGCTTQNAAAAPNADSDNDLLPNALEIKYGLDPCKADTDGDGVEDGYEYRSAKDLNSANVPFPGKRPYPNPLDSSDANTDFDGDGLTMSEEYNAWARYFPHRFVLSDDPNAGRLEAYSDGLQATQSALPSGPLPVPPGKEYLNTDGSCSTCQGALILTDDEQDVDGDGIGNWDEIRGAFGSQNVKHLGYQPLLDYLDPDTDGDGIPDGADDQDHDATQLNGTPVPNTTNVEEIQDAVAPGGYQVTNRLDRVVSNPLDPCDPDINSSHCPLHPQ